jgi:hypothetical protein
MWVVLLSVITPVITTIVVPAALGITFDTAFSMTLAGICIAIVFAAVFSFMLYFPAMTLERDRSFHGWAGKPVYLKAGLLKKSASSHGRDIKRERILTIGLFPVRAIVILAAAWLSREHELREIVASWLR